MLPDVLQPGLKLVICGTAVGDRSALAGAYYAGPGNKLWRTLKNVGLTPRLLVPREYVLLPQFGIGLTDLCKRKSGLDHSIESGDFDVELFKEKIRAHQPSFVCFNGKKAAQVLVQSKDISFGLCEFSIGNTKLSSLLQQAAPPMGTGMNNRGMS